VGVMVGVTVGVKVVVAVAVVVGVKVAVSVGVWVGVLVWVGVNDGVGVYEGVTVNEGVIVGVNVSVAVGVMLGVKVAVGVNVFVGVAVGAGFRMGPQIGLQCQDDHAHHHDARDHNRERGQHAIASHHPQGGLNALDFGSTPQQVEGIILDKREIRFNIADGAGVQRVLGTLEIAVEQFT
jgi:hypothetical protein